MASEYNFENHSRKLSPGKIILAGEKQVYRIKDDRGRYPEDFIGLRDENADGVQSLVESMMKNGKFLNQNIYDLPLCKRNSVKQIIDFLPYKPGASRPVASAPFKALMCFCLYPPGADKFNSSRAEHGVVVDFFAKENSLT